MRDQILVHFYRAVVGHMDVWRQRMDATTNWAAATAAGMITFAFGAAASSHVVLLLALGFQGVFLLMESRRYQVYDLWRRRFRTLNQHFVSPALTDEADASDPSRMALKALASDLGRTVPHLPLLEAIGYRIRRNYGYLFLVTLLAWVLRLQTLPEHAASAGEIVARARVGALPGGAVLALVGVAALGGSILALRAPSEGMIGWTAVPAPLARWSSRRRAAGPDRAAGEPPVEPGGPA